MSLTGRALSRSAEPAGPAMRAVIRVSANFAATRQSSSGTSWCRPGRRRRLYSVAHVAPRGVKSAWRRDSARIMLRRSTKLAQQTALAPGIVSTATRHFGSGSQEVRRRRSLPRRFPSVDTLKPTGRHSSRPLASHLVLSQTHPTQSCPTHPISSHPIQGSYRIGSDRIRPGPARPDPIQPDPI